MRSEGPNWLAQSPAHLKRNAPPIIAAFGNVERAGRWSVPDELQLWAMCANIRLDLREAEFPQGDVLVLANSLCSSVTVLLPAGSTVIDRGVVLFSGRKLHQSGEEGGPVLYVEGWSVFSDVKFISG